MEAVEQNIRASKERLREIVDVSTLPALTKRAVEALVGRFHDGLFIAGACASLSGRDEDCRAVVRLARALTVEQLDSVLVSMQINAPEVRE